MLIKSRIIDRLPIHRPPTPIRHRRPTRNRSGRADQMCKYDINQGEKCYPTMSKGKKFNPNRCVGGPRVENKGKRSCVAGNSKTLQSPAIVPFSLGPQAWPIPKRGLLAMATFAGGMAARIGTTYSALKHKIARGEGKAGQLTDPKDVRHLAMKWISDITGSALPTCGAKLAL